MQDQDARAAPQQVAATPPPVALPSERNTTRAHASALKLCTLDAEEQVIIDKTAQFVIRNGSAFEEQIKKTQAVGYVPRDQLSLMTSIRAIPSLPSCLVVMETLITFGSWNLCAPLQHDTMIMSHVDSPVTLITTLWISPEQCLYIFILNIIKSSKYTLYRLSV
jgi:hypothetical protein